MLVEGFAGAVYVSGLLLLAAFAANLRLIVGFPILTQRLGKTGTLSLRCKSLDPWGRQSRSKRRSGEIDPNVFISIVWIL